MVSVIMAVAWAKGDSGSFKVGDCERVHRIAGQLPAQVMAFYGVEGIRPLENIKEQLHVFVERTLSQDPNLFRWNYVPMEDMVLECALNWEERHITLFKEIQKLSR